MNNLYKKLLASVVAMVAVIGAISHVSAAPAIQYQNTIYPTASNTYDIGTTTNYFKNVNAKNLLIPTGGTLKWGGTDLIDSSGNINATVLPLMGTASSLSAVVATSGERVYETDTKYTKVGDGSTAIGSLLPVGFWKGNSINLLFGGRITTGTTTDQDAGFYGQRDAITAVASRWMNGIAMDGLSLPLTIGGTEGDCAAYYDISGNPAVTDPWVSYGGVALGCFSLSQYKPVGVGSGDVNAVNYFMGNVGIGTTSPATPFSVVGNASTTGSVTIGGNLYIPNLANVLLGTNAAGKLIATTTSGGTTAPGGASSTIQVHGAGNAFYGSTDLTFDGTAFVDKLGAAIGQGMTVGCEINTTTQGQLSLGGSCGGGQIDISDAGGQPGSITIASGGSHFYAQGNDPATYGVGTSTCTSFFCVQGLGGSVPDFEIWGSQAVDGARHLSVSDTGNVTIGTSTTARGPLDVYGQTLVPTPTAGNGITFAYDDPSAEGDYADDGGDYGAKVIAYVNGAWSPGDGLAMTATEPLGTFGHTLIIYFNWSPVAGATKYRIYFHDAQYMGCDYDCYWETADAATTTVWLGAVPKIENQISGGSLPVTPNYYGPNFYVGNSGDITATTATFTATASSTWYGDGSHLTGLVTNPVSSNLSLGGYNIISSSGKFGVGTSSPTYKLDVYGGGSSASSMHQVKGNTGLGGSYWTTAGPGNGFWSVGARFNGTSWVAEDANPGIFGLGADADGAFKYYANTGVSAGVYSPTLRMTVDASGNETLTGTMKAASYKSSDGSVGTTTTATYLKSTLVTCTMNIKNGLIVSITGSTCP